MMSLNWTNCGLLWGARAMPNGFGSLFADAPVKSSPMPLGLGIGIVAGNFTSVCHGPTKDVPPTATFGALMMKSFLITDPWEKKPVKRPMWNDGTIPCANDWVVLGRFTRKTLSFSKLKSMHETCLRLFIHQYNQELATIPT